MTHATHDSLLDRIAAARKAREASIGAAARPPATTAHRIGAAFVPGDRVFDAVSGQHGTVEASPIALQADPSLVYVRTDTGSLIVRAASKLVARPSPPSGV